LNRRDTTRISTALGYLETARKRPNLTIRARCLVRRLLFDGNQAVGAELANGERVSGKRIVLAAGAIGTPAILLRSGIGPAKDLRELGIEVRLDCPGVGTYPATRTISTRNRGTMPAAHTSPTPCNAA
jgi:choline dehydrogenase